MHAGIVREDITSVNDSLLINALTYFKELSYMSNKPKYLRDYNNGNVLFGLLYKMASVQP